MEMEHLSYDLHIHSCLSPCGDNDMLPSNIVGMAALKELDVIAVTDHNSCGNCKAVMKLAEAYGIVAIPGMELTTEEEVHVVCLFPELKNAEEFSSYVHSRLMKVENNADIFGDQYFVDEDDKILGTEPLLLINATSIGFDDVYDTAAEYGGVMIPAHIDKSTTSLLSNLGFILPDSKFSCAEVKHIGFMDELAEKHTYLKGCSIINNSDAHYLEDIHEPVNFLDAESRTIPDILKALEFSRKRFLGQ